jgi:hypothetical protein
MESEKQEREEEVSETAEENRAEPGPKQEGKEKRQGLKGVEKVRRKLVVSHEDLIRE